MKNLLSLLTALSFALLALLAPLGCKGRLQSVDTTQPQPERNKVGSGDDATSPRLAKPATPTQAKPGKETDVLALCETNDPKTRREILSSLEAFPFGQRNLDSRIATSQELCVLELLPAAIFVNWRTGIPAGTLIGQAIQETGWCKSKLAIEGKNYHGQKVRGKPEQFTYWDGGSIAIDSSESPTGMGNIIRSSFMKFAHPDHSFYSVAERFLMPELPYRSCLPKRENTTSFMACIGKHWAVHTTYTEHVLQHRANFRSANRPKLRLDTCELGSTEWNLDSPFVGF